MTSRRPRPPRRLWRVARAVVLLTILLLVIGVDPNSAPISLTPLPAPTPRPSISVVAGELGVHDEAGEVQPERLRVLGSLVTATLDEIYELAFLTPAIEPTASPATPRPAPDLTGHFTAAAAAAIRSDRAVFRTPPNVELRGGRVTYDAVITIDLEGAVGAWVDLTFSARGRALAEDEPERSARLSQRGTLLLTGGTTRLAVSGYDLELEDRRETDGADSRALAQARWMP